MIEYFLLAFVGIVIIITALEFTPSARAEKKRRLEESNALFDKMHNDGWGKM